jgi:hypothetical protein
MMQTSIKEIVEGIKNVAQVYFTDEIKFVSFNQFPTASFDKNCIGLIYYIDSYPSSVNTSKVSIRFEFLDLINTMSDIDESKLEAFSDTQGVGEGFVQYLDRNGYRIDDAVTKTKIEPKTNNGVGGTEFIVTFNYLKDCFITGDGYKFKALTIGKTIDSVSNFLVNIADVTENNSGLTGLFKFASTPDSDLNVTLNEARTQLTIQTDVGTTRFSNLNFTASNGIVDSSAVIVNSIAFSSISYISATGGTITTDGDYKVHTFNSSSTFTIVSIGSGSVDSAAVDAIIVAGGGGGGGFGGGGSGGYLNTTLHTVSVLSYPITIGASGAGSANGSSKGSNGSDSIFDTFTSAGGGGGGAFSTANANGLDGGSGGGGGTDSSSPFTGRTGGSGNTPSTTPSQGNNGGSGVNGATAGGGGGGSLSIGLNASFDNGGSGGNGTSSSITGSAISRSGGGGGGGKTTLGSGINGGGNGKQFSPSVASTSGAVNTGGGGGGGYNDSGSAGGSGVVVIRYKFQ